MSKKALARDPMSNKTRAFISANSAKAKFYNVSDLNNFITHHFVKCFIYNVHTCIHIVVLLNFFPNVQLFPKMLVRVVA